MNDLNPSTFKEEVNNILQEVFNEPKIENDSKWWRLLIKSVGAFDVEEEDISIYTACRYIRLKYKSLIEDPNSNKEAIKIGNTSYEGNGAKVSKLNKALTILDELGYTRINLGVVDI